ncbi:MAG TPA: hypothetical protein VN805_08900 [Caulobacteraceae bacterium]|nr:hypothetical protein [Caulobacteraceae bacterium]
MVAAPIAASAQPYGGFDRGHAKRGFAHSRYRGDGGAVLAAGLFGLVLGAVAADAANNQPVAYEQPYYGPQCGWETQAYRNAWGQLEYQQVQVCR